MTEPPPICVEVSVECNSDPVVEMVLLRTGSLALFGVSSSDLLSEIEGTAFPAHGSPCW